jgi:hypothetical protein
LNCEASSTLSSGAPHPISRIRVGKTKAAEPADEEAEKRLAIKRGAPLLYARGERQKRNRRLTAWGKTPVREMNDFSSNNDVPASAPPPQSKWVAFLALLGAGPPTTKKRERLRQEALSQTELNTRILTFIA